MTSAAVATAARRCVALNRAHRLATWVGEGKPVTPKHVLRPRDVPAAALALGIPQPDRTPTAANIRDLHRPWKVAQALDFLQIVDGRAVAGPALEQWPVADDAAVGEWWLTGLVAAFIADTKKEDKTAATTFVRTILTALGADPPPTVTDLWRQAYESLTFTEAYAVGEFFDVYRFSTGVPPTALSEVLVEFGAATQHGEPLNVTSLGRWALQAIAARLPKPITADLPASELIARVADAVADSDEYTPWQVADQWLTGRNPLQAAREILAAAASATPAQRIAAVEIVDGFDEPPLDAWREVTAVPNLAAYARLALTDWSRPQPPEPSPEDRAWLAVDYAMTALAASGPDEALSCIDERIDGPDLDSRLQTLRRRGNHPDTAALAAALTTFVASGVKPTSSQVYQLKITLKRMRPPIWRRVLIPAAAPLGLLHAVIQIVMNWDGDHLHAFSVRDEDYGDPFYSPDLCDEDNLRLSAAFTPATKTITYLYDFGASWYHDITREKVLDLDPDATYPICVTGAGDFPIEYWSEEDEDQQPIPFDQDMTNRRLTGECPE
ncbi:MAG: plasmid pRiA4b ORF-3 family protein [Mycobacterium sp.]